MEIAGAILAAFGFFIFFLAFESKKNDMQLMKLLCIAIVCIVGGGWMILRNIDMLLLTRKLLGVAIAIAGLFLVKKYPGSFYQETFYMHFPPLLGMMMILAGAYMALF